MTTGSPAALVAVLRRNGLDAPGIADTIERDSSLDDPMGGAGAGGQGRLSFPGDVEAAAAELDAWTARGVRFLSILDADYPTNLQRVHDRPAALWVAGSMRTADERAIAVVGTRSPNPAGIAAAERIASDLARAGVTVVSGLAAGIDAAAHRAAMRAGGRTLAVIGTGLDHSYPAENARLQARIATEHAVLSPFWPETPPRPETFRRRNGVVSGLARGAVIVEASPRSGTRVLARLALGHGRPLFLLPALLDQPWAAALAERPGVHVVDDAAAIVEITDRLADLTPPVA